jgi:WD40 repeat protein
MIAMQGSQCAMNLGEIELHIGHQNSVNSIAFSTDGRTLVSGGRDGAVKLWDVPTGNLVRTMNSGWDYVDCVAVSPDGTILVAAGGFEEIEGIHSEVRLWDAITGRLIRAIDEWVTSLAFLPKSDELYGFFFAPVDPSEEGIRPAWDRYGMSSPEVIAWDARTGEERARLADSDERVQSTRRGKTIGGDCGDSVTLMPADHLALGLAGDSSHSPGSLELWDTSAEALLWRHSLPGERFLCASPSPDGSRIATGGRSGVVRLHDTRDGRVVEEWTGHKGWVRAVAFSPDGRLLASAGDDGTVRIWDVEGGQPGRLLGSPRSAVRQIAISPDGRVLAGAGEDLALRLWDLEEMSFRKTLVGHTGEIKAVVFSPDGRTLASGGMGGLVRLWGVATGDLRWASPAFDRGRCSLAFSGDGAEVVGFGAHDPHQGAIISWAVDTGERLRKHGAGASRSPWRPGVLSADARLLATQEYDPHRVSLWDVASGSRLMALRYEEDHICSLSFSADGGTLLGGGMGFRAILWDARSGSELRSFRLHRDSPSSIAFHPDGKSLVLGTNYANWVTRWDIGTGRLMRTYSGHRHAVRSVAWAPDGSCFASGSDDGTIKLWKPDTGVVLATLVILPAPEGQEVSHDWVAIRTGGYFLGSPGARQFVRRRVGDHVVPIDVSDPHPDE